MSDPSPDDRLAWKRLGELARSAASAPVSESEDNTGRMRLMVASTSARRTDKRLTFQPLLAAAITALIAGGGALAVQLQSRPLTYQVYGGQRFASNYVGAHASEPAKVKFSDGTEIDARPGSRLRIDETRRNGARVLIERGTAAASVKHRERSRWQFVAGPFDVRVIGTKFDLDWDPVGQVVSLELHEGAVEVASPVGQSRCVVRAGQRFRASIPDGTMTLETLDGEPVLVAKTPPPDRLKEPGQVANSERAPRRWHAQASTAGSTTVARPSTWPKLVRRGDFHAVVEAALAGDVGELLASCSAVEARALADAARYTDRAALAERALLAIRTRFPDSRQSRAAGFLLGRTSETNAQPEQADRWYRVYLDEAPTGEFAAEALAGRMRAVFARSGAEKAKPIAEEYLERFPQGVHLRMARRLLGQP